MPTRLIPFEVPCTWKPDFVEYNTGQGNILKWPIQGNRLDPSNSSGVPSRASSLWRQGGRVRSDSVTDGNPPSNRQAANSLQPAGKSDT
jgi:hypothetical protein